MGCGASSLPDNAAEAEAAKPAADPAKPAADPAKPAAEKPAKGLPLHSSVLSRHLEQSQVCASGSTIFKVCDGRLESLDLLSSEKHWRLLSAAPTAPSMHARLVFSEGCVYAYDSREPTAFGHKAYQPMSCYRTSVHTAMSAMLWRWVPPSDVPDQPGAEGEEMEPADDPDLGGWELVWSAASGTGPVGCHWAVLSHDRTCIFAMDKLGSSHVTIHSLQLNTLEWSVVWSGRSDDAPPVVTGCLVCHSLAVVVCREMLMIIHNKESRQETQGDWSRNRNVVKMWRSSAPECGQKFELVFRGVLPYFSGESSAGMKPW